jgi:hypothetical protein
MGMLAVKKGDFFPLFWAAWQKAFTPAIILSSYKATGLSPWDPEVVLARFRRRAAFNNTRENRVQTDGRQWPKLHTALTQLLWAADVGGAENVQEEGHFLYKSFHNLTVENELFRHELAGLKEAIVTKKKRANPANTLPEPDNEPYYGGAKFWSPKKFYRSFALREERTLNTEAETTRKAETAELKAIEKELKQIQLQDARHKRAEEKDVRDANKARKRVEINARKAPRAAAAAAKRTTIQQQGRQRTNTPKPRQRAHTNKVAIVPEVGGGDPGPSTLTTRAGRSVALPARFS